MDISSLLIEYHKEFRSSLFISGFTLGAFLFSMKSVIIKIMKDDYYDRDEYKKLITERRSLGDSIGYYTQLINFSKLISKAIYLSFLSAIFQVTIGFIATPIPIFICIATAFISWVLVATAIYYVSQNWIMSLEWEEVRSQEKFDRKNK